MRLNVGDIVTCIHKKLFYPEATGGEGNPNYLKFVILDIKNRDIDNPLYLISPVVSVNKFGMSLRTNPDYYSFGKVEMRMYFKTKQYRSNPIKRRSNIDVLRRSVHTGKGTRS